MSFPSLKVYFNIDDYFALLVIMCMSVGIDLLSSYLLKINIDNSESRLTYLILITQLVISIIGHYFKLDKIVYIILSLIPVAYFTFKLFKLRKAKAIKK